MPSSLATGSLLGALLASRGGLAFAQGPPTRSVLLAAAGPITAMPLLWFAAGARRIPLARVGFLQYLAPTLQLGVGVLVFGESFTATCAASFGLIWAGVAVFLAPGMADRRAAVRDPAAPRTHQ